MADESWQKVARTVATVCVLAGIAQLALIANGIDDDGDWYTPSYFGSFPTPAHIRKHKYFLAYTLTPAEIVAAVITFLEFYASFQLFLSTFKKRIANQLSEAQSKARTWLGIILVLLALQLIAAVRIFHLVKKNRSSGKVLSLELHTGLSSVDEFRFIKQMWLAMVFSVAKNLILITLTGPFILQLHGHLPGLIKNEVSRVCEYKKIVTSTA